VSTCLLRAIGGQQGKRVAISGKILAIDPARISLVWGEPCQARRANPTGFAPHPGNPRDSVPKNALAAAVAVALALAFDRGADFATSLSQPAPDVPADLVALASGAHIVIACRAPDDFLRNALELLAGALQLLFG
jgi:hypothetical protein